MGKFLFRSAALLIAFSLASQGAAPVSLETRRPLSPPAGAPAFTAQALTLSPLQFHHERDWAVRRPSTVFLLLAAALPAAAAVRPLVPNLLPHPSWWADFAVLAGLGLMAVYATFWFHDWRGPRGPAGPPQRYWRYARPAGILHYAALALPLVAMDLLIKAVPDTSLLLRVGLSLAGAAAGTLALLAIRVVESRRTGGRWPLTGMLRFDRWILVPMLLWTSLPAVALFAMPGIFVAHQPLVTRICGGLAALAAFHLMPPDLRRMPVLSRRVIQGLLLAFPLLDWLTKLLGLAWSRAGFHFVLLREPFRNSEATFGLYEVLWAATLLTSFFRRIPFTVVVLVCGVFANMADIIVEHGGGINPFTSLVSEYNLADVLLEICSTLLVLPALDSLFRHWGRPRDVLRHLRDRVFWRWPAQRPESRSWIAALVVGALLVLTAPFGAARFHPAVIQDNGGLRLVDRQAVHPRSLQGEVDLLFSRLILTAGVLEDWTRGWYLDLVLRGAEVEPLARAWAAQHGVNYDPPESFFKRFRSDRALAQRMSAFCAAACARGGAAEILPLLQERPEEDAEAWIARAAAKRFLRERWRGHPELRERDLRPLSPAERDFMRQAMPDPNGAGLSRPALRPAAFQETAPRRASSDVSLAELSAILARQPAGERVLLGRHYEIHDDQWRLIAVEVMVPGTREPPWRATVPETRPVRTSESIVGLAGQKGDFVSAGELAALLQDPQRLATYHLAPPHQRAPGRVPVATRAQPVGRFEWEGELEEYPVKVELHDAQGALDRTVYFDFGGLLWPPHEAASAQERQVVARYRQMVKGRIPDGWPVYFFFGVPRGMQTGALTAPVTTVDRQGRPALAIAIVMSIIRLEKTGPGRRPYSQQELDYHLDHEIEHLPQIWTNTARVWRIADQIEARLQAENRPRPARVELEKRLAKALEPQFELEDLRRENPKWTQRSGQKVRASWRAYLEESQKTFDERLSDVLTTCFGPALSPERAAEIRAWLSGLFNEPFPAAQRPELGPAGGDAAQPLPGDPRLHHAA